jgi:hypothetical protein
MLMDTSISSPFVTAICLEASQLLAQQLEVLSLAQQRGGICTANKREAVALERSQWSNQLALWFVSS